MKKLEIIAFISGASVMIVELLATRIIAPYLGVTLFSWTSIIAVILGALSLGYYIGGKLADKRPQTKFLSLIILFAGIFVLLIPIFSPLILAVSMLAGIAFGPLIASIFLFSIPSILFGMVVPYIVKLATESLEVIGYSAGRIYAISTVGSIVGTLVAGYLLIGMFGVSTNIMGVGLILIFCSLALLISEKEKKATFFAFIILVSLIFVGIGIYAERFSSSHSYGGEVLFTKDSQYYKISVIDDKGNGGKRILMLDSDVQGGEYLDSAIPTSWYLKAMQLAFAIKAQPEDVLSLGIGPGILVKETLKSTNANVDAVEIDPEVIKAAKQFFNLEDNNRTNLINNDARIFLRNSLKQYDIVFVDVFSSHYSIPFHLTTLEAVKEIKNHLKEGGVVSINLISALEGEKSKLFRSIYRTYKQEFQVIHVIAAKSDPEEVQNIIILATLGNYNFSKQKFTENLLNSSIEEYVKNQVGGYYEKPIEIDDVPILTDDYAPTDNLLALLFV